MYIYKGKKHDNVINANYRITVNSRLLDTPLLRTVAKSPAETTKKCMEITPAITDCRYYGIADTSCGPKQTFLLFYSRYNGHSRDNGHLTLLYLYCCTLRQRKDISHSCYSCMSKVLKFLVCILPCIV